MRSKVILVHRYAGLCVALFLMLAGLSGAILVWQEELDAWLHPEVMRVTPPGGEAVQLDPLVIRERLAQLYPDAELLSAKLSASPGHSLMFRLTPKEGGPPLVNDQVFVDPYSGAVLGERRWGDLRQGSINAIPFIYQLHYSLVMHDVGVLVMGIVALVWAINSIVGAWLTVPPRFGAGFWSRWWLFFKVRWRGTSPAVTYDLHRAGGLWLWGILLVQAWSAVAFNLPEVYKPVMRPFGAQPETAQQPLLPQPLAEPVIGWQQARDLARSLMVTASGERDFTVIKEDRLSYLPERGLYRYRVVSSRDVSAKYGSTELLFDARTGELKNLWLPTGEAAGDTIYSWITRLHLAAVGGLPMRMFFCVLGLAVTMLSVTGLMIWWRKRRSRAKARASMRMGLRVSVCLAAAVMMMTHTSPPLAAAAGAVPRTRGEAEAGGCGNSSGVGAALALFRLAERSGGGAAGAANRLAQGGLPASLAMEVASWASADSERTPRTDPTNRARESGVGSRAHCERTAAEARSSSVTAHGGEVPAATGAGSAEGRSAMVNLPSQPRAGVLSPVISLSR